MQNPKFIYKSEKPYTEDINDLVEKGGVGSGSKGHTTYHPESFEHHRLMAGYHETKAKYHGKVASNFKGSSDKEVQAGAGHHEQRASHHSSKSEHHLKQAKEKHNPKEHGSWNSTIPKEHISTAYGEKSKKPEHHKPKNNSIYPDDYSIHTLNKK